MSAIEVFTLFAIACFIMFAFGWGVGYGVGYRSALRYAEAKIRAHNEAVGQSLGYKRI